MSRKTICIGDTFLGDDYPCYIIAEIGINHNGSIDLAKKLIDSAIQAKCDAVKFQKREPELSIPEHQKCILRETPWGEITYLEYKKKMEFGLEEFKEIDNYCKKKGITWFASAWDEPSIDFLEDFDVPVYKVASASITDMGLLARLRKKQYLILLSTGMSDERTIDKAIEAMGGTNDMAILHTVSTYPAKVEELNLRVISAMRERYNCPIGYSGHEVGLSTTYAAVALGANIVERHITLDRSMWGTDQAASVEPMGLMRLVRDIRVIESAMGGGIKSVLDSERPIMYKLRKFNDC